MRRQGYSRAVVLDDNHGIQRITKADGVVYAPWYYVDANGVSDYYVRDAHQSESGWRRVECATWIEAFDHIARSRRMLTSKHAGSNYLQEAENAGRTGELVCQTM